MATHPTITYRHTDPGMFHTPPGDRRPNPFSASYDATMGLLAEELRHLEATSAVLALVLSGPAMVRRDGLLRQNADVLHPGVAITITSPQQPGPIVIATDRFAGAYTNDPPDWQINLRAIAVSLRDLRRLDRYGTAQLGQQYAGFRELGTGTAVSGQRMTRADAAKFLAEHAGMAELNPDDLRDVHQAYVQAARRHHPDTGGNPATMAYINAAHQYLVEA